MRAGKRGQAAVYAKKKKWAEMDASEKLGYVWVILYFGLIAATAAAILYPAFEKWREENKAEKQGWLRSGQNAGFAALFKENGPNGPFLASGRSEKA